MAMMPKMAMPKLAVGLSLLVCLSSCCEAQLLQRSLSRSESQEASSLRRRLNGDFDDLAAFLRELKTNTHNVQDVKSIEAFTTYKHSWPLAALSDCLSEHKEEEPLTVCLQDNSISSMEVYQWGSHEAEKMERKADKLAYRKIDHKWVLAHVRTISQKFNVLNNDAGNFHEKVKDVILDGELLIYKGKAHAVIQVRPGSLRVCAGSTESIKIADEVSLTKGVFGVAREANWLPNLELGKENIESSFTLRHKTDDPVEVTGRDLAHRMQLEITNSEFLISDDNSNSLAHVLTLLATADFSIDPLFNSEKLQKFGISTTNHLRTRYHGLHSEEWSETEPFGQFAIDIPLDGIRGQQLGKDLVARLTLRPEVSVTAAAKLENSSLVGVAKKVKLSVEAKLEAQKVAAEVIGDGSHVSQKFLGDLIKMEQKYLLDLIEMERDVKKWSYIAGDDYAFLLVSSRFSFEILEKKSVEPVKALSDD